MQIELKNGRPSATSPVLSASAARKADHLRINLTEPVQGGVSSGFGRYRFLHQALPEMDLAEVSLTTSLFGRALAAPILVSCMTGGVAEAGEINRRLARVAQAQGLALGLGSARVLLEHPEVLDTFAVRALAPDVPLLANLGAAQLGKSLDAQDCRRILDLLDADALVLHLNPLQEALQPEGEAAFSGLLARVAHLCRLLDRPVVVKEVGWGISPDTVRRLLEAGVAAIDVAGAGGTSWSEVERHRQVDPVPAMVAAAFEGWGLPTAEAVLRARRAAPEAMLIASGGLKDGLDVAKAIGLGADLAGLAGPFLRAAAAGQQAAHELAEVLVGVLRIAMFCIGARNLGELRGTSRLELQSP